MSENIHKDNNLEENGDLVDDDWEENEKWECYLCGNEEKFSVFPDGYLGNYHPLCLHCANEVLYDNDHEDRFRLTYHSSIGDINMVANVPVPLSHAKEN